MESGVVSVLDSDKASYEKVAWHDKGDALAVLKTIEDKAFQDKLYVAIGFTGVSAKGRRPRGGRSEGDEEVSRN